MKRLLKLILLTGTLCSQAAFANKIIGNGGTILDCTNRVPHVRLLGRIPGMEFKYPGLSMLILSEPEGLDYREKFESLVARIATRFPDLAERIMDEGMRLADEEEFEAPEDEADLMHSSGCTVQQNAYQSPEGLKAIQLLRATVSRLGNQ